MYKEKQYEVGQFRHERDSRLIGDMMQNEAAEKIFAWAGKEGLEDIYRGMYEMSCVAVTEENLPEIAGMAKQASRMFGLRQIPRIYLRRGYEQTIEIGGLANPFLVVSSDFLELTAEEDPRLLSGMIAGRIAGIRAGHGRGMMLFWILETLLGYLPIPAFLVKGLEALVNEWNRCRYFTYDRAFLLAEGDYALAQRSLFIQILPGEILDRFALGSPKDRYTPQADRFWEGLGAEGAIRTLNSLRMDDPWIPERYRELKKFRETMGRDGYDGTVSA